ncbi:MAG: amidohydrolase family protein [Burkholderiales bacterium]|nr:amidohydrolase family protein [Burkholderiales bacterium]
MRAIDVHTHWFPKAFLDFVAKHGPEHGVEWKEVEGKGPQFKVGHLMTGPVGPNFTDLDARLAMMDAQGVAAHAVSLSQPHVYWAGRTLGEKLAALYNEELARMHEHAPRRLFGLATLPMHEPDLAAKEVERAAKLAGMRGFYLSTVVNDRELSDPVFFPVYERIEALALPIFLHPIHVIAAKRLEKFYLTNLLGNPFEAAVAAAHLIFGGVMDRFPALEWVLPHAGGAFPWLAGRLNRGWEKRADLKHIQHPPAAYLKRFYYDTVGYSNDVLDYLVRVVGSDRILMGSDYCFPIAYEKPVEIVTAHPSLTAQNKQAICEANAARLLRL